MNAAHGRAITILYFPLLILAAVIAPLWSLWRFAATRVQHALVAHRPRERAPRGLFNGGRDFVLRALVVVDGVGECRVHHDGNDGLGGRGPIDPALKPCPWRTGGCDRTRTHFCSYWGSRPSEHHMGG